MKKIFFIGLILLVLAGCAVGPKYARPEQKKPEAYTQNAAQADSITNLKWWDVYQDSVLQGLIRKGISQNLDLKIAVSRLEQSKAILGVNKANLWPSIGYTVGARVNNLNSLSENSGVILPTDSYYALGNVSWEIGLWGKLRHANRAAYAELMASEENRKSFYISMVAQIAELYFQLRGFDERFEITRRTNETRKEYLRIITLRFDKGEVSELDKVQAEQLTASSEARLYSLERSIIATENAINIILGEAYSPIPRGLENSQQLLPLEIPSGLPSQLLERRPDILASEQLLIAQTEKAGMAVSMRFPTINLTGFFGFASPEISTLLNPDAAIGSITGQLTGPLFKFGQNKRRAEAENELAHQYAFQYEKVVVNAFAEVENSLTEVRTYRGEFNARQTQVVASERALLLSKALYDNGYTSFLQVLDAERELYNSEFFKSTALESQLIATVRLYKALGGGW